jgi:hypothetical protein
MQLYIGNLFPGISSLDLRRFLKGIDVQLSFEFKYFTRGNKRFYFAVSSDVPADRAQKAIKRRHMKRVNGRVIVLREYKVRAVANERRALNWREKIWEAEERRKAERRQLHLDKHSKAHNEVYEPVPAQRPFSDTRV